jgi:hypothetical protein
MSEVGIGNADGKDRIEGRIRSFLSLRNEAPARQTSASQVWRRTPRRRRSRPLAPDRQAPGSQRQCQRKPRLPPIRLRLRLEIVQIGDGTLRVGRGPEDRLPVALKHGKPRLDIARMVGARLHFGNDAEIRA